MSHILIVDDEELVLNFMQETLQNEGFEVLGATTGQQALDQLASAKFDLLITDIIIPDISGLDIIDKAVASNINITVLAISGGGTDEEGNNLLDLAITYGADAVLEKPFNSGELVRTVKALLR